MHGNFLPSALGPRLTLRLISFLLYLGIALALPACAEEPALQGTVTWVYDGDTLKIEPMGKVRLIGIDAPEREDSQRDNFLGRQGVSSARQREIYRLAKEFNIRQVKNQKVLLTLDDPPSDRHGRLLAYVYLPDGRMLNQLLLEQGLAVVYRKFSFRMKEDFLAAEAEARNRGLGLWTEGKGNR